MEAFVFDSDMEGKLRGDLFFHLFWRHAWLTHCCVAVEKITRSDVKVFWSTFSFSIIFRPRFNLAHTAGNGFSISEVETQRKIFVPSVGSLRDYFNRFQQCSWSRQCWHFSVIWLGFSLAEIDQICCFELLCLFLRIIKNLKNISRKCFNNITRVSVIATLTCF